MLSTTKVCNALVWLWHVFVFTALTKAILCSLILKARRNFVYKNSPTATPMHLTIHNYRNLDAVDTPRALKMNGNMLKSNKLAALKKRIDALKESGQEVPSLAALIVSGNADSERYIECKLKAAKKVGIKPSIHRFEKNDAELEDEIISRIRELNVDQRVNGIMVQLPLPAGVDKERVLGAVCPTKDVDGFHASHLGSISGGATQAGSPSFVPCTAKGIISLLDHYAVNVMGKKVCIVGRSNIAGLPTQLLVMKRGASVTNVDINTGDLPDAVQNADIVIAAAGSPGLIKAEWIKPGAVIVDVGFHVIQDPETGEEQIVGDVEEEAARVASLMTPVPGGVGPMTVASLMENTFDAFDAQSTIMTQKLTTATCVEESTPKTAPGPHSYNSSGYALFPMLLAAAQALMMAF